MKVEIVKGELVIRIPVSKKPVPSKSGKTLLVATTRGNKETECVVGDQNLIVSVNAYIYKNKRDKGD